MKSLRVFGVSVGVSFLLFNCNKKPTGPLVSSWEVLPFEEDIRLSAISFVDDSYGWATGWKPSLKGEIYHTSDGGNTWVYQPHPKNPKFQSLEPPPLYDIFFFDREHGWAVGEGGSIYNTIDGGNNWVLKDTLGDRAITTVYFTDLKHGWIAAGVDIGPHRTTDGGQTWEKMAAHWRDFTDSLNGWTDGSFGEIYRTYDGGVSWVEIYEGDSSGGEYYLDFADLDNGWIVKKRCIIDHYQCKEWVVHTTDGGYIWDLQLDTFGTVNLGPVATTDRNNVWIAKHEGKATILHTRNGGFSWSEQPLPDIADGGIRDMDFINEKQGWAVAFSPDQLTTVILRTSNGGNPIR